MDSDYKKYSLEQLDNWMHDAMSSGGASPQEIYDVIVGVVKDNYYTYKQQASQAYELLALLNGNGKGHLKSWDDFWKEQDYQKLQSQQYTEEELNAMCDKAASDQEKEKCREYNLREAEYYDKRVELDAKHSKYYYDYARNDFNRQNPFDKNLTYDQAIADGWEMTADGFWIKEDKRKKWILPVEEAKDADTDKIDYFVCFPDDLLEAADLKEGDQVRWVDNGDGSYTITKVTKPLGMDEC